MKRVCFSLLFSCLLFSEGAFSQNLIPNPSVEDYYVCPEGLGGPPPYSITQWLHEWISLRGTPDFFNNDCLPGLGSNNPLGYQEPHSGDGYLGAIMYASAPVNAKEYFGIQFSESLIPGETYYCSFHVSMAFRDNWFRLASNRIGFLMMTENYLLPGEQAQTPNRSSYEVQEVIADTTNWVEVSTTFVADSAYTMIAFGAFYDADSLLIWAPFTNDSTGQAYYYLDDFCVTTDPEGCVFATDLEGSGYVPIEVFPNPSSGQLFLKSSVALLEYEILDLQGRRIRHEYLPSLREVNLQPKNLEGMYIIRITTEKGVQSTRVFFNPQ